jgi:hypothetical protein
MEGGERRLDGELSARAPASRTGSERRTLMRWRPPTSHTATPETNDATSDGARGSMTYGAARDGTPNRRQAAGPIERDCVAVFPVSVAARGHGTAGPDGLARPHSAASVAAYILSPGKPPLWHNAAYLDFVDLVLGIP